MEGRYIVCLKHGLVPYKRGHLLHRAPPSPLSPVALPGMGVCRIHSVVFEAALCITQAMAECPHLIKTPDHSTSHPGAPPQNDSVGAGAPAGAMRRFGQCPHHELRATHYTVLYYELAMFLSARVNAFPPVLVLERLLTRDQLPVLLRACI